MNEKRKDVIELCILFYTFTLFYIFNRQDCWAEYITSSSRINFVSFIVIFSSCWLLHLSLLASYFGIKCLLDVINASFPILQECQDSFPKMDHWSRNPILLWWFISEVRCWIIILFRWRRGCFGITELAW